MDPLYWKSLAQGIVQGVTEFLPVSSTGHMILFDEFLEMGKPFSDLFEVVIQLGSILSVLVYFRRKIFPASLQKDVLSAWFFMWLKVGAAVVPALVVGGMFLGCTRPLAAEFSFFLAIPTMLAATAYSLMKHGASVSGNQWIALVIGFVTAFLVAWGVIALFMNWIRKHDFKIFGWYRIVLAVVVFALCFCGLIGKAS